MKTTESLFRNRDKLYEKIIPVDIRIRKFISHNINRIYWKVGNFDLKCAAFIIDAILMIFLTVIFFYVLNIEDWEMRKKAMALCLAGPFNLYLFFKIREKLIIGFYQLQQVCFDKLLQKARREKEYATEIAEEVRKIKKDPQRYEEFMGKLKIKKK